MQASEDGDEVTSSSSSSSGGDIQGINARFMNITEAWQAGLAAVTTDLASLREESRASHVRATSSVNEAERRLKKLAEKLEEFEDSTRLNSRAFERTEQVDTKKMQEHLDWNTARVGEMAEKLARLARADGELAERLDDHEPRVQQCQEHLPAVEEAVRSILRLAAGLAAVERRVEELSLQGLVLEDSMLKGLTQTLHIRHGLDALTRRRREGEGEVAGGPEPVAQEHSAGSEIDAMLEALREMDMERESRGVGEEEEEVMLQVESRGVGEEEEVMLQWESRGAALEQERGGEAGGGPKPVEEEQSSPGSNIDAMLEALREMDMERESRGAGEDEVLLQMERESRGAGEGAGEEEVLLQMERESRGAGAGEEEVLLQMESIGAALDNLIEMTSNRVGKMEDLIEMEGMGVRKEEEEEEEAGEESEGAGPEEVTDMENNEIGGGQ